MSSTRDSSDPLKKPTSEPELEAVESPAEAESAEATEILTESSILDLNDLDEAAAAAESSKAPPKPPPFSSRPRSGRPPMPPPRSGPRSSPQSLKGPGLGEQERRSPFTFGETMRSHPKPESSNVGVTAPALPPALDLGGESAERPASQSNARGANRPAWPAQSGSTLPGAGGRADSGSFTRLPSTVRQNLAGDVGLERDLEIEDALADFIAQYDGELAAIGQGPSVQAARLHLAIGRMLELAGHTEAAGTRYAAARDRAPESVTAMRELRRLAWRSQRTLDILELLEAESHQVERTPRRAALYEERSRLLRRKASKEQALAELDRVHQLVPDSRAVVESRRAIHTDLGNWEEVVEALVRMADLTSDGRLEMAARLVAAEILEHRLGRDDEALDTYVQALKLVPSHRVALTGAERLLVRRERWHELYDLMVRQGQAASDPEQIYGLYIRAGLVAAERLGDHRSAVSCFESAHALRPNDPLPLRLLAEAHRGKESAWQRLDQVYGQLLDLSVSPRERAALTLARAENLVEHVHPPDVAIDALLALHREQPSNVTVLDRLLPMLAAADRHTEYVELAWAQAERTEPGPVQRERFVALGELCEFRIKARDRARACYHRALDAGAEPQLDASFDAAFAGLERILVEDRADKQLAELYAQTIERTADDTRRASLLWRLAVLQDAHLGEPMAALQSLERYRELRPDELPAVWMQQRLHSQLGIWTGVVGDLRDEIRLTGDAAGRAELHFRIASLQEQRLDDAKAAIASCRAALGERRDHRAAHRALMRLLRAGGRWDELAQAIEAALPFTPRDEQATLLHELGTLYTDRTGESQRAIDAFERALQSDPDFLPAFDSLRQLHRATGDWAALREVLERELESEQPPIRRAGNLTRIGALMAERFNDPDQAVAALTRAIEAVPGYAPATQALERIHGQFARWDALSKLLGELLVREENVETRAHTAYRFASLLSWRLGRTGDASQPLELALALAPDLPGVRLDLEMLYRQVGHASEAAELLYEIARNTDDEAAAVAFFKESCDIQSLDLGGDATRSLHRILQHDALDPMAIERLEAATANRSQLAELWQRRLQQPEGDEFVELRLALAEVVGGSHPGAASDLLQEAVDHAPGHLPALRMAANAAVAAGHHEAACALREKEAEVVQDPRTKVAALLAAARIARDQLGQFARARRTLRTALEQVPARSEIYEMLAELLGIEKLWDEQIEILRLHIDALEPLQRPARLLELMRLQRDRQENPRAAVETLHELLEIEPDHTQAIVSLAQLQTKRERWNEAVEAWRSALATGKGSTADRRHWRLQLATALLERLDRPFEAEPVLGEMLQDNESDDQALRMLAQLYQRAGRLDDTAVALERLANVSPPAEAAAVLVRLARVLETLEREDEARTHLASAAAMIRKDVASLDSLMGWAEETGNYEALAELLESVLVNTTASMSDAMIPVRLALATVLADKLGKRDAAEREARMAATNSPQNVDAQLLAARLQVERAEARRYATLAIAVDPFRPEPYRILAQGFEQAQLPDAVLRCYQVLCVLNDADETMRRRADELVEISATPQVPLGAEGLLQHLAHPNLPDWGRELLFRAGPRAQIFVLDTIDSEPCPETHPVRAQAYRVAAIFGASDFELHIAPQANLAVTYDAERPNRLILGQLALQGSLAEMRYHIGRGLAPMLLGTTLLELLDDRDFVRLLQGLIGLAHNGYGEEAVVKQLGKFLPRRNRKAVIECARAFDPRSLHVDLGNWRRAMTLTARRAGLLASRDTRAAIHGLLRSNGAGDKIDANGDRIAALRNIVDAGDLLGFTVSDNYARVRRQLGMNRDPAGRNG